MTLSDAQNFALTQELNELREELAHANFSRDEAMNALEIKVCISILLMGQH